jgi:nucleolar MIF4G domain-containing protein 1
MDRTGPRPGPSRQTFQAASASEEESESDNEAPPPTKPSKNALGKRPAKEDEAAQPAKKKRKLPELTLPGPKEDDVEDQEIEWLEWMLKKEKDKGKDDELSDGLDGESHAFSKGDHG